MELLVALHDRKAGLWYTPMNVRTEAEAVRVFGEALRDPNGMCGKYPSDFGIFHVGDYDPTAGRIVALDDPRCLIMGDALVRRLVESSEANGFSRVGQLDIEEAIKNGVQES